MIFQNTFRSFINVCYSFPIHFFSANNFLISSVIFVISNSFHFCYVVSFSTFFRDFPVLGRDFRTTKLGFSTHFADSPVLGRDFQTSELGFSTFSRDFHCLGRDSRHHPATAAHPTTAHPTTASRPTTVHPHSMPHHSAPHHGAPHHGSLHHGAPHHDAPHHDAPHHGITHRYGDTSHCSFSTHFIVIIIFYKGNN